MNNLHSLSVIFGTSLVLLIIFKESLWRTLWIFGPILLAIVGIGCFFILLNAILRKHWQPVLIISVSVLIAGAIYIPTTELLKSPAVLKARLIDDLSGLSLTLREDKTFVLVPETWMGKSERFKGRYEIDGTRIIFLDQPYDNDFIPDTVDIYRNKIILNGDIHKPDTSFARYFEIQLNLLKIQDSER